MHGNARLIDRVDNYGKIRTREVIEIEKRYNNLNGDNEIKLSESWRPMIYKLKNDHIIT